jgi:hypothetical protein
LLPPGPGVLAQARVRCDSTPLTTAFQNLITTAITRRRRDRQVEKRIDCARRADDWRVTAADNGVGVDPEFAAVAFSPLAFMSAATARGPGSRSAATSSRGVAARYASTRRIASARIVFALRAHPTPAG